MSMKKRIITIIIGIEAVVIAAVVVFLFCINSDTVKVNRQLELAQRYLLEEDYEQAIAAFEIIIEIDPKNVDAYLGLAEAYVLADELGNAVKTLEKAAEQTDSKEILEVLAAHTAEIGRRQLAAQRAAETAALASSVVVGSTTNNSQYTTAENMLRGFIVQDGEMYYYDEMGNFVIGWFDKNNNRYCARADGRLYKDGEYEIDGTKYLFDYGGVCLGEIEDKNKQLSKKEQYRADGTLTDCRIYSYDNQGNLIREEMPSQFDSQYDEYILYSYDNQGNLIREETFFTNGNRLCSTSVNGYDSQGKLIRAEHFDSRTTTPILLYYMIYSYDDQGNKVGAETFEGDGPLVSSSIYSYDNQGRIIKSELHHGDGSRSYINHSYDDQGKIIRDEEDFSQGSYKSYSYTNYNYDNQGKITKEETYCDGTLEHCVIYDNEGYVIREERYYNESLDYYIIYSY